MANIHGLVTDIIIEKTFSSNHFLILLHNVIMYPLIANFNTVIYMISPV